MKRTLLIGALSLLIGIPAFAQNKDENMKQETPEMRAQKMTDDMARDLKLSEEQRESLYEVNLRKTTTKKDNTEVSPKMDEAYEADLKEILDEEQYRSYSEMKGRKNKAKTKEKTSKKSPDGEMSESPKKMK